MFARIANRPRAFVAARLSLTPVAVRVSLFSTAPASDLPTTLKNALKENMKSGDKARVLVIKSLLSEITYAGKASNNAETPETVLLKAIKKRKDASAQYMDGGRPELAEAEDKEISIIQTFLPRQLSVQEIDAVVEAVVTRVGATSPKEMGKVMKEVDNEIEKGSATKQAISEAIKRRLTTAK